MVGFLVIGTMIFAMEIGDYCTWSRYNPNSTFKQWLKENVF